MTSRCLALEIGPFAISASLGALLMLAACSSSDDVPPSPFDTGEDGSTKSDGGASSESGGDDAGEAEEGVTPPPYDFAVRCTAAPCATAIAARGGAHACALLQDGSVRCWGSNASGQLGTGRSDAGWIPGFEATPRPVVGVSNVKTVTTTGEGTAGTTCVVTGGGDVACFGSDRWGQLGRAAAGSPAPNPEPRVVEGLRAKSVTLASTFALAVGTDDRLWSWGANDVLQLARATPPQDAGSANAAALADRVSTPVRSCAGTSKTGFVVAEDGTILSWGGSMADQLGRSTSATPDPLPTAIPISNVSMIATGAAHACALGRGHVFCWGRNEHGQLGTGRKADEPSPARVILPSSVYPVAVGAGASSTCILAADGDVYCWGANRSGQLGTSAGLDRATPTRIGGLSEESLAIAIMDDAICALLRGGSVACWGDNVVGQLGRGRRDSELHQEPALVVFE